MILSLNDDSIHNHIIIDDLYKLFIIKNVTKYLLCNYNTHEINVSDIPMTNPLYYFVIDLLYNDTFGHWVYESAMYLHVFHKLKDMYPTIKLLLKTRKNFKSLFLNFFDINETDVVYDDNMNTNNVCFFPSPIASLNDNRISEKYEMQLENFVRIFSDYQTINKERIDYVIMPRQTKENYFGNDRSYNMDFVYDVLNRDCKRYFVLKTDHISDITEQITNVRSSNNVILTDGSPFIVNIMFCKNQRIYVVDNITNHQSRLYIKMKHLIDTICAKNNLKFKHVDINCDTSKYTIDDF